MTTDSVTYDIEPVRRYVQDTLLGGRTISDDENLLLSGLLDSLSVMSLVAFVEQTYAFRVPFEDVVIENFETITAIKSYVQARSDRG